MLLYEFFGRGFDPSKNTKNEKTSDSDIKNDLFWFILDHDKLHKDYFMPLARKIKVSQEKNKDNRENLASAFMPMVKKGCLEYYEKKQLKGNPTKIFSKEFREELCEKLYNHYFDDIIHGCYTL